MRIAQQRDSVLYFSNRSFRNTQQVRTGIIMSQVYNTLFMLKTSDNEIDPAHKC